MPWVLGIAMTGGAGALATTTIATVAAQLTGTPPTVGTWDMSDAATVSGRVSPVVGATITFWLYEPDDPGLGTPEFTATVDYPVIGGSVSSGSHTPARWGTYHWIAEYSGDAHNLPVTGLITDADEAVIVTPVRTGGMHDATDMLSDGTNIWIINGDSMYKIDPAIPAVVEVEGFDVSPGALWGSLAFDGTNFWMSIAGGGIARAVRGDSLLTYFAGGSTHPTGIAANATTVFTRCLNFPAGMTTELWDTSGTWLAAYTDTVALGGITQPSIIVVGSVVWYVGGDRAAVIRLDPATGTMTSFTLPGATSVWNVLASDGTYIWLARDGRLTRINPSTGVVDDIAHGFGGDSAVSLVNDGDTLWWAPSFNSSTNAPLLRYVKSTGIFSATTLPDGDLTWNPTLTVQAPPMLVADYGTQWLLAYHPTSGFPASWVLDRLDL